MRCVSVVLMLVACTVRVWGGDAAGLFAAVRGDDRTGVARLLQEKTDPNSREPDGATPLAWAAWRMNTEVVALLLGAGADPNLANELGVTPLAIAVGGGSAELTRLLLEHKASPLAARESGETPLMTAARMGRTDLMQMLLRHGADPNAREKQFGQTALMWAAGHPEAVRLLLESGADPRPVTKTWNVKYTFYLPTTVTLGKTGIPWNNDGDYIAKKGGLNALFFAIQRNDAESVRALLSAGLDVNGTSADGTTPLLAALHKWDPPESTFVPGRGAPATAGSSQRFHPNVSLANLLLERGAKVSGKDGAGYTPLHGAALAVARAARNGARQRSAYGQTAAALALGTDSAPGSPNELADALALVRRLLDAGADPNQQTVYPTGGPAGDVRINPAPPGSSPLHIAASSGSLELVQTLAARGGNPNLVRRDGHTPLSVAVLAGDVKAVRELVARGGDVKGIWNPQDKIPDPVEAITLARQKQTILHLAAIGGNPEMLTYLHSLGASLTATNSMGETPLDLAEKQERYREAIQRQGAEDDPERLKKIVRVTTGSDTLRRLASGQAKPQN